MTLIDRVTYSIALDLSEGGDFPSDYHDFLDRIDALIPKALHGIAPDDSDLIYEWVAAGHPGAEHPASIPVIAAIRDRLENYIATSLDPWDVLDALTGALSDTVRQEISAAPADDREYYFDLLRALLGRTP